MTSGHDGIDRLLPRHELPFDLEIEWDVTQARGLFGKSSENAVEARLRDISLDGALIEVPMPSHNELGDRVSIRFRGEAGTVKIRHRRPTTTENRMLYGVQINMTPGLREVIIDVVDQIQGTDRQLQEQWERAH